MIAFVFVTTFVVLPLCGLVLFDTCSREIDTEMTEEDLDIECKPKGE